ncbi:histidine kinase N-terminal 7TM domain-containing diguanylate cyclase [Cellulomonas marina]|nr:diguanylate cyclase [Cellulomonas marina]
MPFLRLVLVLGLVVAAGGSAAVAALCWRRRRRTPAARTLAGIMVVAAVWCLVAVVAALPVPLWLQYAARWSTYLCVHAVTFGLWALCRDVTSVGGEHRLDRRTLGRFAVVPVVVLVAITLNPWRELFFAETVEPAGSPAAYPWAPDVPRLVSYPVLGYWLHSAYCYALSAAGLWRLVRAWPAAHRYFRRQLTSLLVAAVPPIVLTLAGPIEAGDRGMVDVAPLGFVVTGLTCAHALFRQGLLSVVPVVREHVVERIADAVAVLDPHDRVVDLNAAGRALVRRLRPDLPEPYVGHDVAEVLPLGPSHPLAAGRADVGGRRTLQLAPGLHAEARTSTVHDRRGRPLGRVVVLRDVSEEVAQQVALDDTARRLEQQQRRLTRTHERLAAELEVNERLRERLDREAATDALTGVANRRALAPALTAALAAGTPAAVLVVDLDRFKVLNDTHGHAAGDLALRAVAQALQAGVRPGDTLVRSGGEEFVVVLPGLAPEAALDRAEDLRRRCAGLSLARPAGTHLQVTVSVGVGVAAPGLDAQALVAAADRALYAAKRAGRDRVVLAA